MKDDILDIKEKKEEVFQLVKDAKQSYDDYYSMLGNELYDLDEKKREYEDRLKTYIEYYGDITEEDDKDIYNDYVKIKDKEENNWKNKYLYLQADLENIKKRYNKQLIELRKYEGENIFKDIITDVCDDFDYLLRYNESNTLDRSNIEVIYRRLLNVLDKYGVKQMYGFDNGNRPIIFNSDTDDAVSQITTNDKILDNSINNVIKKGYNFKDKVLRYEQVVVNKYKENYDQVL